MPRTYQRRDPQERFWEKVDAWDCWDWTASVNNDGYGSFHPETNVCVGAHVYSYTTLVGPIPAGLHLDHLCRNHRCVNPDHLEPVTPAENVRRGFGAVTRRRNQTHCKNGHPLSGGNLYTDRRGYRTCRTCQAAAVRRYTDRKAA